MLGRRLITGITILVTILWAVNVVVGFISPTRHDPTINALFATIIGASYALWPSTTQQPNNGSPRRGLRQRLAHLIAGDIYTTPLPPTPLDPSSSAPKPPVSKPPETP